MLVIRSVRQDMTSHDGFVWPTSGIVECPDWKPTATCGSGLHGLRAGDNNPGVWHDGYVLLLEVDEATAVPIGGKIKFPRCEVLLCGDMAAVCAEAAKRGNSGPWYRGIQQGGYGSTITGGYGSTSTGGDRSTITGGDDSTITGGYGSTITGGDGSTITGGDGSTIQLRFWDTRTERFRILVGYVGEDGIEVGVPYVRIDGKLAKKAQ